MTDWFRLASSGPVVHRALKYAVVVCAILIAINHSDAILRGDLPPARLFRMALTVLVPYSARHSSEVVSA